MADSNTVQHVEASVAKLLLDEVTGEQVSKSELKKRQKLREKEAKKKEKEAAAPPKPAAKKTSAEDDEANLTPNVGLCFPTLIMVRALNIVRFLLAILRDPQQENR